MERQLTDKQMHTLRFIHDYIKSNDCPPAMKEIGEALDIPIRGTYDRVHNLFGQGYLTRPAMGQYGRNIALTEKGIRACESFSKK